MKPKSAKAIGREFADWCNDEFEKAGLGQAVRTPGSGSGKKKGDSFNPSKFLMEFKSEEVPKWIGNIRQAQNQAKIGNWDPDKWLLIQRDPASPKSNPTAFAILDYIELLELLKRADEPKIKAPDREMTWKLKRFVEYGKAVLKELGVK